jgi:hypothetical protein
MVAVPRYRPGRGRNLGTRAPCLYPGCRRYVDEQPPGGGRPRIFCSDDCRANFANIQRQLIALVSDLEYQLDDPRQRKERLDIERNMARARWHLARFRPLEVLASTRR